MLVCLEATSVEIVNTELGSSDLHPKLHNRVMFGRETNTELAMRNGMFKRERTDF